MTGDAKDTHGIPCALLPPPGGQHSTQHGPSSWLAAVPPPGERLPASTQNLHSSQAIDKVDSPRTSGQGSSLLGLPESPAAWCGFDPTHHTRHTKALRVLKQRHNEHMPLYMRRAGQARELCEEAREAKTCVGTSPSPSDAGLWFWDLGRRHTRLHDIRTTPGRSLVWRD